MRICALGASGPVGRAVVDQALAAGHDVVAVTRRPEGFGPERAGLEVVGADVRDPDQVATALRGVDAVVFAAGVNPGPSRVTTYSGGTRNVLEAVRVTGVRRIVCVSSKELDEHGVADEPALYRLVFARLLGLVNRTIYADMRRMERLLRDSDAEWTVVRPAGLFAADRVTDYRLTTGHEPGVATSVADLADALVREATTDDRHVGAVVTVLTDDAAPPTCGCWPASPRCTDAERDPGPAGEGSGPAPVLRSIPTGPDPSVRANVAGPVARWSHPQGRKRPRG